MENKRFDSTIYSKEVEEKIKESTQKLTATITQKMVDDLQKKSPYSIAFRVKSEESTSDSRLSADAIKDIDINTVCVNAGEKVVLADGCYLEWSESEKCYLVLKY